MVRLPLLALLLAVGAAAQAADVPAKSVQLATTEWPPYIGQSLPGRGYVHMLTERAFAASGYRAEIRFYPWARALALARDGKVAGLLPEYFDAARTGEFAYSRPFPGGPVGFYVRRDSQLSLPKSMATKPAEALATLKHLRFGVVRGYLNAPVFDSAPDLKREDAKDDLTNLRKLYHRRVDAIVIDRNVAEYLLRTAVPEFAAALAYLEPPLAQHPLYVAFSLTAPDHAALLQAFNRGLDRLEASGELAKIRRQAGLGAERS
ncbi:MAG: substrate-binding periplasmic protein [Gammaproteobacteria bacterium]